MHIRAATLLSDPRLDWTRDALDDTLKSRSNPSQLKTTMRRSTTQGKVTGGSTCSMAPAAATGVAVANSASVSERPPSAQCEEKSKRRTAPKVARGDDARGCGEN